VVKTTHVIICILLRREYALKTPKDVTEETWLGLLDLTLKEIKNGQLKKMKESDRSKNISSV